MHIGILNDPNNFHTQKWAGALQAQGARVTVFSYDQDMDSGLSTVQVKPPAGGQRFNYRSYLRGGPQLRAALERAQVDLINPLNMTPFGVWAAKSGFHPCISSAMGADILEYPPRTSRNLQARAWANPNGRTDLPFRLKAGLRRWYFRKQVRKALEHADLITGDNQYLVDKMREWFSVPSEKSRLLRWGVEPELFQTNPTELAQIKSYFRIPGDCPVVLSPRGAKAIYQSDTILQAFQALLKKGSKAHFIMLGAGYQVSRKVAEQAFALEKQFSNFVFIQAALPRETIYQLWNLVDVFISAPVYDGYSAALAEGRYIGAIPVVNAIPANLELISHSQNGWIVEPFSVGQLSSDLASIIQQASLLKQKFAAPNHKWIQEHSLLDKNAAVFMSWAEQTMPQT